MATVSNIPHDVQESIRDVLDKRVKVSMKRLVKLEIRADRLENRVLALSPCRVFLLAAKIPSKVENSFHFLDIQAIESKKPGQLILIVDGKPFNFLSIEANSDDMDQVITQIGISLKQIFASFSLEQLIVKIDVQPADRLKTMADIIKNAEKKEQAPCGGFTTMYQCMCDYHGLSFREEVAWDVDTIYLSHDSRELRLQDFDHLNGKDLVPIIGALEYNTWFKRVNASNVKLTVEVCTELIKLMRRNAVLEELNLSNTGIKAEFVQKLAVTVNSNSGSQLTFLDLSNNFLEDKAILHLLDTIKLLPCGLTSFDVSSTGITTRCLNRMGEVFSQTPSVMATLSALKINDNGLKGEDFPMLYNYLAQQNAITYLDLSSTDCALDALCDPLLRGCPNLVTLKASKTVFTHKKNKDVNVPLSWKQLFSSMCCLENLDLSGCRLPAEALKNLLLGLSSNRNIKDVFLDLSSNEFGVAGANVLASCISTVVSIKGLDISNNGFDIDLKILLPEIAKNSSLRYLAIGRNFFNIRPKHMPEVMDALTCVLQQERCALESLSLAESKLKADTTYIINALGSNQSLLEIDISGNSIGDLGARLLAKALMINTKLSKVVWDKNNVSAQGFEDVAEALQKNMSLKKMPFPINDAAAALRLLPERTETALQKIESYLQRNHSPRRFASDNAYRLQQGFLISSTQQMVDRLVVQVQDTVNALRSLSTLDVYASDLETADKIIADANNSRQLFSGLQDIAIQSQDKDNPVDQQLHEMAQSLKGVIEEHMRKTTHDMLKYTSNFISTIMTKTFETSIQEGCLPKSTVPRDFTSGVLEGASMDVYNLTSERNLENAAFISDSVIGAVIDSLTSCHSTLTEHLNLRKSGHYKELEQHTCEEEFDDTLESKNIQEVPAKFVNKRESLLSRKTRPQSTAGQENPVSLCVSAVTKGALHNLVEAVSETTHDDSTEQLNTFGDLPSLPTRPLEHVTKGRPRREKTHRATRPIVATGHTEMEEFPSPGLHSTYQTETSLSAECKDIKNDGKGDISQKLEPAKAKQEDAASKKWKPGFMKKNKEDKQEKEFKDTKKSSFSTSFTNIFKKKEEKRRPSASEIADNKVTVCTSNALPEVGQKETKVTEPLEVVRETEVVDVSAKTKENNCDLEKHAEKSSLTSKSPMERRSTNRVAILPPLKKPEAKVTSLDTEEATNLKDMNIESPALGAAVPTSDGRESNIHELPRLPTGIAQTSVLGAVGGKDLLQEMKLKQEKRLSRSPRLSEDEKDATKDKDMNVTSKTRANSQKEKEDESTSENCIKDSSFTKPDEPGQLKPLNDDPSKKDLNDNTTDSPVLCLPMRPTPSPSLSKAPAIHSPRTILHTRRPASIVDESGTSEEPPQSMTVSTPELLLGDGTDTRSRPLLPAKPRPAILPRPKKRDSDKDCDNEESLASESALATKLPLPTSTILAAQSPIATKPSLSAAESALATKPPLSAAESALATKPPLSAAESALATKPPLSAAESALATKPHLPAAPGVYGIELPCSELRSKPNVPEEGIVTDSATLRLSVKDKIKRLSQGKSVNDIQHHMPAAVMRKSVSLSKDTKITESLPEESRVNDSMDTSRNETQSSEECSSAIEKKGNMSSENPDSLNEGKKDDEIMV